MIIRGMNISGTKAKDEFLEEKTKYTNLKIESLQAKI